MKKLIISLIICLCVLLAGCTSQGQGSISARPESSTEINSELSPTEAEEPGAESVQTGSSSHEEEETLCPSHTDSDGDEICDECGRSVIVVIDIYAINDLHGKIMDASTHPGVDELTTYIENARESDDNLILLSIGDMWQGSAESNRTKGLLMTDWMNELGFEAMAMGNHEFDWGEDIIEQNAEAAEFPFLAINIYSSETDSPVEYCQGSAIIECDGVSVGVIGAIGDCYSSISSEQTKGIYFKTGDELTALVKAESERLRTEGADCIIYILHDGLGQNRFGSVSNVTGHELASYYDIALSDGYVDLVFESHTHRQYVLLDEHGVYHLQNGGDNNGGISHVEIELHATEGHKRVLNAELIPTEEYEELDDSPIIDELLKKYEDEIAFAFDVIGTASVSRTGDAMRQLVADLYYLAGLEKWGTEYDIVLGGGYISIREPGYLKRGDVSYAQLQSLFPFDNELVLCSIKGQDLKERFFFSDNNNYFISYGSYGEEVLEALDPNATYYIVTDSYSSPYAPNRLTEIERYGEDIFARDLLAEYIASGGLK